jgi:hypothetical protein
MSGTTGEPMPPGEVNSTTSVFTARQVADAFEVELDRIERAMRGELGLEPNATVTSQQAQGLAEVVLAELPLAEREAALMRLGAFTPRSDVEWGIGDTLPGEESDRLAGTTTEPADKIASKTSSFDPATQDTD